MRIAVAQIDPVVGAFEGNARKIKEAYERACREQARLLLTPELGVCGYPPHDLVERPEMFERCERVVRDLQALTKGKSCALALGYIARNPSAQGRAAQNVAAILEHGKIAFTQPKTLLPTYDVFDEARYFEPAESVGAWSCDGQTVAVAICEDLWARDPAFGRKLYGKDPLDAYKSLKPSLLLSLSASPYVWDKRERRESVHAEAAKWVGAPLVYVNQVGATDEILFDGASFAMDAQGNVTGRLPAFREAFGLVSVSAGKPPAWEGEDTEREDVAPGDLETLSRALVRGIGNYFKQTGFRAAVMGLSGGIDSAVVATLAAKALGPENILGVAMPSQYSSGHSLEDAETLARSLGVRFEVHPIKFAFSTLLREISGGRGELAPIAVENLQSRIRGLTLMTLANHYSALTLTTGNKSELATGYCTLYGDMAGALAPIGDLYKTRVYDLARYVNAEWRGKEGAPPIPLNSIIKPPSAELSPDQKDQDTLPPYDRLDGVLEAYIEGKMPLGEIEKKFGAESWIREILRRVELNEYKRRQAAPVLKVTSKAFGVGRRIPIAKTWDQ